MYFDPNRQALRDMFFIAWEKGMAKQLLSPLEAQIQGIILAHPEYHFIFNDKEKNINRDFFEELGDTNPFLHLSGHLGLEEQLATDRPKGINKILKTLLKKKKLSEHVAKHKMMEVLMQALWQANMQKRSPDETEYLTALETLI